MSPVVTILGIDPGRHGAMAKVWWEGALRCEIHPLPVVVDPQHRARVRLGEVTVEASVVVIEEMWCRPTDSPYSMLPLWTQAGALAGYFLAKGARVEWVSPLVWKRRFGLVGREKWRSIEVAAKLFGGFPHLLRKDHDKADAALIAAWGWERLVGRGISI